MLGCVCSEKGSISTIKARNIGFRGSLTTQRLREPLVAYQGPYNDPKLDKNPMWARPLKMFLGKVRKEGKWLPRFTKINR